MSEFSQRIVCCDHYLAKPIDDIDVGEDVKGQLVPVIRIFGSTPAGQKCCLHVHGVFPYFYVKSQEPLMNDEYLRIFAASLDRALEMSLKTKDSKPEEQQYITGRRYVLKVVPINLIPFYGYHERQETFLKISLFNPMFVKRASELLQNGAVMNSTFQPYEMHIPFVLKFFIDNNLYGMDLIRLGSVYFRRTDNASVADPTRRQQKASSSNSLSGSQKIWILDQLNRSQLMPDSVERQTVCELECDCVAENILNKNQLSADVGTIQNPGLRFIWDDEIQRRKLAEDESQIALAQSQDRGSIPLTESEIYYANILAEKLQEWKSNQPAAVHSQSSGSSDNLDITVNEEIIQQMSQTVSVDEMTDYADSILGTDDEELLALLRSMDHPRAELLTQSAHKRSSRQSNDSQPPKTPQPRATSGSVDEMDFATPLSEDRHSSSHSSLAATPTGSQLRLRVTPMAFHEDQGVIVEETEEQLNMDSDDEEAKEEMEMSSVFMLNSSDDEEERAFVPQLDGGNDTSFDVEGKFS